jgi:hypothetical protein
MANPPGVTIVTSHESDSPLIHNIALPTSKTADLPVDLLANTYDSHVSSCTITSLDLKSPVYVGEIDVVNAVRRPVLLLFHTLENHSQKHVVVGVYIRGQSTCGWSPDCDVPDIRKPVIIIRIPDKTQ